MKTVKRILAGTTLFVLGIAFTLAVSANTRHHDFNRQAGISKRATIEVGAPLTVSQMNHLGLN
ncbi:MAG: hypothetical protein WCP08_14255 [Prolixibacteraceae bacterium]